MRVMWVCVILNAYWKLEIIKRLAPITIMHSASLAAVNGAVTAAEPTD